MSKILWLVAAMVVSAGKVCEGICPFVSPGVSVGFSTRRLGHGGLVAGGELSAGVADDFIWVGGFVDALGDFGPNAFRASIGPEVGVGPIGLDLGFVAQVAPLPVHAVFSPGFDGRLMLIFQYIGLYSRLIVFGTGPNQAFGEFGLQLKWPIIAPKIGSIVPIPM